MSQQQHVLSAFSNGWFRGTKRQQARLRPFLGLFICGSLLLSSVGTTLAVPGRSTTIASLDAEHLIVVNRDVDTVSILQVLQRDKKSKAYKDVGIKLAEIAVGHEPHCVAVHPKWREAYVTNAVSGTVSASLR